VWASLGERDGHVARVPVLARWADGDGLLQQTGSQHDAIAETWLQEFVLNKYIP
jgi:hypothetical protein